MEKDEIDRGIAYWVLAICLGSLLGGMIFAELLFGWVIITRNTPFPLEYKWILGMASLLLGMCISVKFHRYYRRLGD